MNSDLIHKHKSLSRGTDNVRMSHMCTRTYRYVCVWMCVAVCVFDCVCVWTRYPISSVLVTLRSYALLCALLAVRSDV